MNASQLDLPPVIGHRGAAAAAPENTLAGIRMAHRLGARWVEFDVRLSADAQCIVLHDDTVNRTTDGSGAAALLPFAALRCYENYDCTGQQLIDTGAVLINGERVALDLQIAEDGPAR